MPSEPVDVRFGPGTALVVVDMQNDFVDPSGRLSVRGGTGIVPRINELVDLATAADAFVVYTQDWHPSHTPHFVTEGGLWPVHCVAESWGAQLVANLLVRGPVLRKGMGADDGYSAFTARDAVSGEEHPTGLDALLRDHGVREVVVVGLCEDVCVKDAALDAMRLGYRAIVGLDATRPVNRVPGDDERAIAEMLRAGVRVGVLDGSTSRPPSQ